MKVLVFFKYLVVIFFFLSLSCCKKAEHKESDSSFSCDEPTPIGKIKGEIRMFDKNISIEAASLYPERMVFTESDGEYYAFITVDHVKNVEVSQTGFICNFSDFAKKWEIPAEGLKVSYERLTYKWCNEHPGYRCRDFCYYVVLTNLKVK